MTRAAQRTRILTAIATKPDTCDALELRLNMRHQTCSARITELRALGYVRRIGRRETRSGCRAWVLQVTKAGCRALGVS